MIRARRGNSDAICTGSLLSNRIVLTAAHCVDGLTPADIEVRLTTTEGCPVMQQQMIDILADKISVHEDFDGSPESYSDLALIRLKTSAPHDVTRLPIVTDVQPPTSDRVVLLGFGITDEHSKDSQILRRIHKSIAGDLSFKEKIIAINQQSGSGGFCRGDSGAPIIAEIWGEPYVLGVNSATVGLKPESECHTMSIAMSAPYFSSWISENKKALEERTWFERLSHLSFFNWKEDQP